MCDSLIGLGEWGEWFIFVRCMSVCYFVLFCLWVNVHKCLVHFVRKKVGVFLCLWGLFR